MTAQPLAAETTRELTWDHLVPSSSPLEDPFQNLEYEQLADLEELGYLTTAMKKGELSVVSTEAERIVELTHKMKTDGLDVEGLLKKLNEFFAEIDRRNQAVVNNLDDQQVRIPGYALPLEYSETGVQEFLLVPYIGACIHTPPPPPNQMVFVQLNQTFKADDLYMPVWVSGRLSIEKTNKQLEFVDGANEITAGYVLNGAKATPYEEIKLDQINR
ncbi:MAG: DUF3299 domain-containing protein [Rhodospirillales bacterium]|nr:DUF3299 domain-containing protein [Rhodospirillales bacterium]